jgi:hypothetical protein
MMKTNELRIGNRIKYCDDGKECIITGIPGANLDVQGLEVLFDDGEETWIELDQFEPIPLTEEWLERMGFTYEDEEIYYIRLDENNVLAYDLTDKDFAVTGLWAEHKINHVHELQNLYFALTGEELKIKDDETT